MKLVEPEELKEAATAQTNGVITQETTLDEEDDDEWKVRWRIVQNGDLHSRIELALVQTLVLSDPILIVAKLSGLGSVKTTLFTVDSLVHIIMSKWVFAVTY